MTDPIFTFKVTAKGGEWPDTSPVDDSQLHWLFPPDLPCEQLNYGQGEGQALLDGAEWGFYYDRSGDLDVVMHSGELALERAAKVVELICEQMERHLGVAFQFELCGSLPDTRHG